VWSLVVAVILVTTVFIAVQGWRALHAPTLIGTDLGATPAPAFSLVDQNGALISLAHLRGRPTVVTFLYTHCPGPCPLTAEKLHLAAQKLGAAADRVNWIAISLDPTGDTPTDAKTFVETHHLTGRLHFLLGAQTSLAPLWSAYAVAVRNAQSEASSAGPIEHSIGAFVLDAQGKQRVYLDDTFAPGDLATDLLALGA
jgi:protein SCO1/2